MGEGLPFFTEAIGVRAVARDRTVRTIDVGTGAGDANGWVTYLATVDGGTAGTTYPYSTATRGVILHGKPLLIDVMAGARALGLPQA